MMVKKMAKDTAISGAVLLAGLGMVNLASAQARPVQPTPSVPSPASAAAGFSPVSNSGVAMLNVTDPSGKVHTIVMVWSPSNSMGAAGRLSVEFKDGSGVMQGEGEGYDGAGNLYLMADSTSNPGSGFIHQHVFKISGPPVIKDKRGNVSIYSAIDLGQGFKESGLTIRPPTAPTVATLPLSNGPAKTEPKPNVESHPVANESAKKHVPGKADLTEEGNNVFLLHKPDGTNVEVTQPNLKFFPSKFVEVKDPSHVYIISRDGSGAVLALRELRSGPQTSH